MDRFFLRHFSYVYNSTPFRALRNSTLVANAQIISFSFDKCEKDEPRLIGAAHLQVGLRYYQQLGAPASGRRLNDLLFKDYRHAGDHYVAH